MLVFDPSRDVNHPPHSWGHYLPSHDWRPCFIPGNNESRAQLMLRKITLPHSRLCFHDDTPLPSMALPLALTHLWAKRSVPTRTPNVGTLRFAHPTILKVAT